MKNAFVLLMILSSTLICQASKAHAGAVYDVPGAPAGEGSFEMSFKFEQKGESVFADYKLPIELTGAENHIKIEGSLVNPQLAVLKGPKGDMSCDLQLSVCQVSYRNLDFDLNLVKGRLEGLGLTPNQIEARMEISRRFMDDPIGVIHFKISQQ